MPRRAVLVMGSLLGLAGCAPSPSVEATGANPPAAALTPARSSVPAPSRGERPAAPLPRTAAALAVRPSLDPVSVEVLRQALAARDWATRLLVVEALGDLGMDGFIPWLEHALGDPEHDVRLAAVEALRRLGSSSALALLVTVRDDPEEALDVRALAAAGLVTLRSAPPGPRPLPAPRPSR